MVGWFGAFGYKLASSSIREPGWPVYVDLAKRHKVEGKESALMQTQTLLRVTDVTLMLSEVQHPCVLVQ